MSTTIGTRVELPPETKPADGVMVDAAAAANFAQAATIGGFVLGAVIGALIVWAVKR